MMAEIIRLGGVVQGEKGADHHEDHLEHIVARGDGEEGEEHGGEPGSRRQRRGRRGPRGTTQRAPQTQSSQTLRSQDLNLPVAEAERGKQRSTERLPVLVQDDACAVVGLLKLLAQSGGPSMLGTKLEGRGRGLDCWQVRKLRRTCKT